MAFINTREYINNFDPATKEKKNLISERVFKFYKYNKNVDESRYK